MKNISKWIAVILALCMVISMLPSAAFAEGGTVHTLADKGDPEKLINSAAVQDGDTIRVEGTGFLQRGTDAPWVIGKSVTIENGTLKIGTGGILLGADVTFRNINLSFDSSIRNAIIANGHTLTLENVTCGNYCFNLFCGGLIDSNNEGFPNAPSGQEGTVIIKGKTGLQNYDYLGSGNIYAGNLTMGGMNEEHNGMADNGPKNVFNGNAVIRIEDSLSSTALGKIYACGAQQRIPVSAAGGKITLPNPDDYTVDGTVSIYGKVPDVNGAGAGEVFVTYSGGENLAEQTFTGLSRLTVAKGNLSLKAGSSLKDAAVSIMEGGKLNIKNLGNTEVAAFQGGGLLVLGELQTLTITGEVQGTASVAIDETNYNHTESTKAPIKEHAYIQAPKSKDTAFRLLPYNTQPNTILSRDDLGVWTVIETSEEENRLESVQFETTELGEVNQEAELPLSVKSAGGRWIYLDFIPLNIYVNGSLADRQTFKYDNADDIYYRYTTDALSMEVIGNVLCATPKAEGVYTIKLEVPGEYTASGQPLQTSTTLTVGNVSVPEHAHAWGTAWEKDSTHHWHECTNAGCTVTGNSDKEGYAAHTAGDWVTDKTATATESGSRYKACTVCGYEMARETIPATGGSGSGSGGGSIGGGSGGGNIALPSKEEKNEEQTANTAVYSDIPATAWYNDAVSFVTEKGLMRGTGNNTFSPEDHLTRAMLAQILYNNEDKPNTSGNTFADVQREAWYADAVTWATQKGIVNGYGNGQFGPDDNITREQLAVILWRYAGEPTSDAGLDGFTDFASAGDYALVALQWAVEKGILSGKGNGTLDPAGNATRAEVAQMLMNYFQ